MSLERELDLTRQVQVEQVRGAEVDRDLEIEPVLEIQQGAIEHEGGERARQPALLGDRQEMAGLEQPSLRVLPADERLDAMDAAGCELRLGLVVQDELPGLDRVVQLAHQGQLVAAVLVSRGQVDLVAGPLALRLVHRHVGALQES